MSVFMSGYLCIFAHHFNQLGNKKKQTINL